MALVFSVAANPPGLCRASLTGCQACYHTAGLFFDRGWKRAVKYAKGHLSHEQQADLLISRGLEGERSEIVSALARVNYYRLTGYWFTFRKQDGVTFHEGTTFEEVWRRYVFDRQLRVVVMDAIERVEIAVRACLAYHHSRQHGPFGYATDSSSLPDLKAPHDVKSPPHDWFMERARSEHERSKDQFVKHFDDKYGDEHADLPIWEAVEIMSFGTVLSFYKGVDRRTRQAVADILAVGEPVVTSWLMVINTVRNVVAHHGRLWNRELGTKPYIPLVRRKPPTNEEWHSPVEVGNERMFPVLTILLHCLHRIAPRSRWRNRLFRVLSDGSPDMLESMGFPKDWHRCPIWM